MEAGPLRAPAGRGILHYHDAAPDFIAQRRQADPNLWSEFEWLHSEMLAIEKKHKGLSTLDLAAARKES